MSIDLSAARQSSSSPPMQRPYYNRGLAHEGQGDIDTALADDEKALELFKQTGDTKSYDMLVEYVKQRKPQ